MSSKLNFQAKEWLPPGGLSKQFRSTQGEQDDAAHAETAQLRQNSVQNISTDNIDIRGSKKGDYGCRHGNIEQAGSLSSNSDILGDTDELQFEEVFDPHNTSDRSSPRSTPKASVRSFNTRLCDFDTTKYMHWCSFSLLGLPHCHLQLHRLIHTHVHR